MRCLRAAPTSALTKFPAGIGERLRKFLKVVLELVNDSLNACGEQRHDGVVRKRVDVRHRRDKYVAQNRSLLVRCELVKVGDIFGSGILAQAKPEQGCRKLLDTQLFLDSYRGCGLGHKTVQMIK